MSSRFPPSGFNPRDRSPQRFDRRPPAGPRGSDDALPPYLPREPPRGPKALIDSPRGAPFGGRGRGYGRGDFRDRDRDIRGRDRDRDRDFRDPRDFRDGPPPFRRDADRDWSRRDRDFDPRDSRPGFRRGRSRSPPSVPRDYRDTRDPVARDSELFRMRRNSRDSIHSSSSINDGPPPVGHHPRGGALGGGTIRGRGRGRGSYLDDRDSFRRRSRSRDGRWDRDRDRDRMIDRERMRDRDRDRDRGLDRRASDRTIRSDRRDELQRRFDRDDRERPGDQRKNDRPLPGIDARLTGPDTRIPGTDPRPTNTPSNPPPSIPPPSIPPGPAMGERLPDRPPQGPIRKPSMSENRRDSDRWESPLPRPDTTKDFPPPVKRSPPPSAPQVPAFGSLTAPIPGLPEKSSSDVAAPEPTLEKAEKPRPEPPSRAPVMAPTGPKAERAPPQPPPAPRLRRDEAPESPSKPDLASRIAKPPSGPAAGAPKPPLDVSPPTAPAAMANKEIPAGSEAILSSHTGSAATSPDFGRTPPSVRTASISPQTSPRMQLSSIPTGPRALQQRPPPPRGSPKTSKPWARSSYGRAPSLPTSTTIPRRGSLEIKERSFSASEESRQEVRFFDDEKLKPPSSSGVIAKKETDKTVVPLVPPKVDAARGVDLQPTPEDTVPEMKGTPPVESDKNGTVPDFSRSSDEDEDERIVFTQDYLEERKQKFENDVRRMRANIPAPPLEDPTIVALLLRIQLLGSVVNDERPEHLSEPEPFVEKTKAPFQRPATHMDYKLENEVPDQGSPMKLALEPLSASNGVSVENLPFLQSGPPTPISDLDVYQENAANHESFKEVLRGELIRRRKEIARKNADLREDYLACYKPWRLDVWELDRSKGKHTESPGPVSPPAPPIITPPSIVEGRRYKGNSELDFQNALRASEISAQEELERRRGNKATAQPDLSREAIIPDMLEPQEIQAYIYKDSNNMVESAKAKDVFGFLPPINDFTPEEHEKFTDAFMAHPKRWGKIAESLPGRDFQQCIVHYYLTKEEIKYKAKLNKRWSRRGRAKRSVRPKSNALMADLGVVKPDYEGEEEPAPVTDTGRPRRAAAPTFGDSSAETDQVPSGRRGKDGELTEKPVSRRGGRTGPGSRGGRRGRAAQQLQTTMPPEQPTSSMPATPGPHFPKAEMEPSLDGASEAAMARVKEQLERETSEALPRARPGRSRAREGMYVFDSMEPDAAAPTRQPERQPELGYGSLQPTSYWSVPEQRDFPQLLAHFGRDFEGISHFMKTKTTVMVKNYFQRRIDSGQKDFEDIVLIAEGKKARGEPTGPLPVPSVAPKRRYEATPSAIGPRPLAPHAEPVPEVEDNRYAPKTKPAVLSPQPAPLHARTASDRDRNVSRYPPLAQASSAPMSTPMLLSEDPSRALRPQAPLPHRLQGPRLGYFTEDRREFPSAYPAARPQESTIGSRQPVSPAEAVRMESLRPSADIHGSPLLSQTTIPLSQQGYLPSQVQPSAMTGSHSRHTSLTHAPGSPIQSLPRLEPEISSIRRDSFGQRQLHSPSGHPFGMPQLSSVPPASREIPRPGSTPSETLEPPRQTPAKRSNIMNILNDEPEEPQPRKRFASERASPVPSATGVTSPRPTYSGLHSLTQPTPSLRQADSQFSASQRPVYTQQSQYLPPPRTYSEYQGYGGSSGTPANNDWMARFDPRGQQQQPPQPNQRLAQPMMSPYPSNQPQSGPSMTNLTAPSPAPAPLAPTHRSAYPSLFAQPSASHMPSATASRQELPSQNQIYRQSIGSPPPRSGSISYSRRPPTPIESPGNLLNTGSRPISVQPSYPPSAQTTPGTSHLSSGQQTYHQRIQTMVNGAHHQQPTHLSPASFADGGYGRNTPSPQLQSSRVLPGPSSLALGRSYTPPSVLHPNTAGGVGYASGGASTPGAVPSLHSRHPASISESAPGPGHQRVYSQGSNAGTLTPQHPR